MYRQDRRDFELALLYDYYLISKEVRYMLKHYPDLYNKLDDIVYGFEKNYKKF